MAESTKRRKNQRADGRYMVQLTVGTKPDGKPIRKTFYGDSKSEAVKKRDEYKQNRADGLSDEKFTVAQWVDRYVEVYHPEQLTPKDAHKYRIYYDRIKRDLGALSLDKVRPADVQRSVNGVAGMSTRYISSYVSTVCKIFRSAYANHLIRDDPGYDIQRPSGTSGTHRALSRSEVITITSRWRELPLGLPIMMMLWAGLRKSEALAMDWDAVDMDRRLIHVRAAAVMWGAWPTEIRQSTKTAAGLRDVPICQPLWDALDTVPIDQRTGLVCPDPNGCPYTNSLFASTWKRVNRILADDLPLGIRTHDMRHTFATMLYDAGVPVKAAQHYLGHASASITLQIYTHLSAQTRSNSDAAMMDYLGSICPPKSD